MKNVDNWHVNNKRVHRIYKSENLQVANRKRKKKKHINNTISIGLKAKYRSHIWSYDFVSCRTYNSRKFRILTIIDEYTRECLALKVERRLNSKDVLETLADLFLIREKPKYIRSDNGAEFTAKILKDWLNDLGVKTLFINKGSPWENGYNESFNGKLRDELLNLEIFYSLIEAKVLIEKWRFEYNYIRPHSSLGYRPPIILTDCYNKSKSDEVVS